MAEALLGEMMVMFQVDNGSLPFFQLKQLLEECRINCNNEGIHKGPSSTIWFGLSIHAARENVLICLRHSTLPQIIMGLKKVR